MMGRFTLLCLGIAVGSGCGSVGPSNNPDAGGGGGGSFTLSATPTTLNIPIASTGAATIAINRTGAVGDVMLSAQNLPSGITATFATNPVPSGTSSSDVTFAIAPGTPAGMTNVTIVGTASGSQQTTTVTVTAQTITVSGKIRGGASGVTVGLVGKPSLTSAADGSFTFTDVSPPYDLYTVGSSGFGSGTPTVFYFQGLTRPDPTVSAPQLFFLILPLGSSGTVAGAKSGNTDTTNPITVVWDSGGTLTGPPSSYSFSANWPKATTRTGTLYGFQFSKKASGAPDVFTGYGSSGQTTISENTTNTVNLVMAAPTTAALTGAITAPAGFPNPTLTLTQQIGASNSIVLWTGTTTAADATIPLVSAGKAAMFATATLNGATTSFVYPALAAATDVTFALPAPSLQNAPLDQAVGITATTSFTWAPAQSTVYEVIFATTTTQGAAKARYQLYTTSSTAALPVVPELTLPSNQSFTWAVNGYGPTASINDAASATGLEGVAQADFDGPRHWFTNSTDRAFTTAP